MVFSSGSDKSLISGTALSIWVHQEHNPLVNAGYAASVLEDHLVHNLITAEDLLPNPQPSF